MNETITEYDKNAEAIEIAERHESAVELAKYIVDLMAIDADLTREIYKGMRDNDELRKYTSEPDTTFDPVGE